MIILEDNFKVKLSDKTYIALGSFDGLHLGHMSLISECIKQAKKNNSKSMVFTFKNHPLSVINKEFVPKTLMSNEDKSKVLQNIGIDILNFATFDKEFMNIYPEDFIKNLVETYNVKGIIVGFNYRFGYKNLGDIDILKSLSGILGFELFVKEPIEASSEVISSSKIRNIISEDGDLKKANFMLTRNYSLQGKVIHGKQIGRTINFPTINLDYDKSFVIPRGGVYYTGVLYNGVLYKGITNIGYNPTVNQDKLSIETHILNFDADVYGECVKLHFITRIRDEKKFSSLNLLKEQLIKDKLFAEEQNLKIIF